MITGTIVFLSCVVVAYSAFKIFVFFEVRSIKRSIDVASKSREELHNLFLETKEDVANSTFADLQELQNSIIQLRKLENHPDIQVRIESQELIKLIEQKVIDLIV